MKKILFLAVIFSLTTLFNLLGQTTKKSLNYQAVILDPKAIDIPGASLSGQPLSKGKVCLKFTFVNAQGNVDYEETQQTTTDEYGLVSISVGTGTYNAGTYRSFESIVWDANVKSMKVAVSYDGCNSFKQVSTQALNYTPYALYAEAVDYKNVKDAPTKLSQFSNDVGYLIPKDLDPIKADIKKNTDDIKTNTADIKTNSSDIKTNASQIASANQTIAENKKASDDSFLIVKQSISDLGIKVISNTNSIVTIEGKINEQQNLIYDTRNQLNTTTSSINGQINGLQNQVNTTANTVNTLVGDAQIVANKSTASNLGGASPSDNLYPSQKAAKTYVDNAIYNAVGTGVADATTLAPGKVQLAGDLAGTATAPTVPGLANKENLSNKSNATSLGTSNDLYPTQNAVKVYVDQATQGIALQAAVDAKADKNSPIFTGTPNLPTGTIAVTQNGADNSTKIATTAFVQAATAAGIIDASSTTKGKLKLAGDLGGTAESPTVPGLALKANSADVTSSLALKEDASNKSTATALGTSDALYPSQKAVKTYVDAQIASATIADADPSTKGKIQLAGDLGGTAAAPTVPSLALKANTADVTTALGLKANSADVNTSLALKEDASNKSTATALGTSDALYPSQKAVKTYVDAQIASANISIGTIAGTSTANGASITSGVINLTPADGTNGGIVTIGTQTFAGAKTFTTDAIMNGITVGRGGGNSSYNTAIGLNALLNNTGSFNTAVGRETLINNAKSNNSALGYRALKENINGYFNVAVGSSALLNNTDGNTNVAIGNNSLSQNTVGNNNTAIGNNTLSTNTVGNFNTVIGNNANVASNNLTNATALGYGAKVSANNTIQLGADGTWGTVAITNVKTTGSLTAGAVTYPNIDGTTGQVLITDGNGLASFGSIPSATNLATPRNIYGGSFDGSADITNIIESTYGGTGNGFTKFTGPSSYERIFTLPDADATILTSNTAVTVAQGGTGLTTAGTDGQVLTSSGGSLTWATPISIGNIAGTSDPNGASITSGVLNLAPADGTNGGIVTIGTQTFAGVKTFSTDAIVNGITVGRGGGNQAYNTASGVDALHSNTTGDFNIASGVKALYSNQTGSSNVATGSYALYSNTEGNTNTAIGNSALQGNTTGNNNSAYGHIAGRYIANGTTSNTTSDYSVYLGANTKASADNAQNEVVIGYNAIGAGSNTIQLGNTSVTDVKTSGGITAGKDLTVNGITVGRGGGSDTSNTVIGKNALVNNTTGNGNTANGWSALQSNQTGSNNTAIGAGTLNFNTTGGSNTASGVGSLYNNTTGENNTASGTASLYYNTTGTGNIANGYFALFNNSIGNNNTAIGLNALQSNTTGSGNTTIGNRADVGFDALNNATAIGYGAVVSASNTIQLGADGTSGDGNNGIIPAVTNVKTSGTLTAGTVTYPNAHNSTSGQVLITDGNGFASFGSIPVLNQTTTGSAATLTTPRTIHGGSFDGSANVTNIIASTYGGTGNGFTKFTGPSSSEKTFTLPDADATILTSNTTVTVAQGGTGTNNGSITGTSALTFAAGGTNQNVSILASGTGSVGIGTNSPSSSAALDVSSTAKGFLPPRLTTTQRDAITNPVEGLTIWNNINKQLEVYDGTYWVTMNGKLVSPINVGDSYGGGKVAYIFTSTDLGYVAGQTHGLIAAVADQTTDAGIQWFPDKFYGATVTALGLGLPNTISIIAAAVVLGKTDLSTYAAGLANNYKGGGYNDWFLPSRDELNKLFINRAAIGGFATTGTIATYWSSSQKGSMNFSNFTNFANGISSAYQQFFFAYNGNSEGTQTDLGINNLRRVRAVRIF